MVLHRGIVVTGARAIASMRDRARLPNGSRHPTRRERVIDGELIGKNQQGG
jgi:hypothetical protein